DPDDLGIDSIEAIELDQHRIANAWSLHQFDLAAVGAEVEDAHAKGAAAKRLQPDRAGHFDTGCTALDLLLRFFGHGLEHETRLAAFVPTDLRGDGTAAH